MEIKKTNTKQMNFKDDPNIGLYAFATDKLCISGFPIRDESYVLKVPVVVCTTLGTPFAGIFYAGNSSGIVVPSILEREEIELIKENTDVLVIDTNYSALGNLMVINDNGIIFSSLLKKEKDKIKKFFGLEAVVMNVAGLSIVGSIIAATNNGCLVCPQASEKEIKTIEKALGVKAGIGTVNFGSPFPRSAVVANSHGAIISDLTSGHEATRVEEALGFI